MTEILFVMGTNTERYRGARDPLVAAITDCDTAAAAMPSESEYRYEDLLE